MEKMSVACIHHLTEDLIVKKARPVKAGSHNLHNHLNQMNTEKIPAQW